MGAFYSSILQEQAHSFGLTYVTPYTISELRERGLMEYLAEDAEAAGMKFIGPFRVFPPNWGHFFLQLTEKTESVDDLKGRVIAAGSTMAPAITALGMTPAVMAMPERYIAMERGVADGAWNSIEGGDSGSYPEVANYYLDHPVYAANHWILMNLDKFNSLPVDLQKLLLDTALELEADIEAEVVKTRAKSIESVEYPGGYERLTYSEADAQKFKDISYDAAWAFMVDKYPEATSNLEQILLGD
jgi:TRAP-type C4-dicarboxylate transport system substrate-binding protein